MASLSRPTLLVVGAGFLGREVSRLAQAGGWEVIPVVRSEESAEGLRGEFAKTRTADALAPDFWSSVPAAVGGIVWAVAPSRARPGDNFETMQQAGAVAAARWAARQKIPYVYLSSTSVYAEDGGGWVDEDAPVAKEDARAMAMVIAEQAFLQAGGSVVRCAGLYGQERVLRPEAAGPERWLNLVHVEDAARAVGIALRHPGQILNACEDEPRRRGQPGGSWPEAGRRVRRNKRVRNGRLRALGWMPMAAIPDRNLPSI